MKNYKLSATIFLLIFSILSFKHSAEAQAGTLDTSFGTNGVITSMTIPNQGNNWLSDAILQPDGKIVVGGSVSYPYGTFPDFMLTRFLLARYKSDGNLDPDFGVNGISAITFGHFAYAASVSLQPDGKILTAGTRVFYSPDLVLARYNADGSLDTSFGAGGTVIEDFAGFEETSHEFPVESFILPDNKILIIGKIISQSALYPIDNNLISVFIARYNPDGTPDMTFGNSGKIVRFNSQNCGGTDSASMQPDGKILVSGRTCKHVNIISEVTRYNADGTVDTGFAVNGALRFSQTDAVTYTKTLPNGEIMIFNHKLMVFNADGTFNRNIMTGPVWVNDKLFFPERFDLQNDGKIIVFGAVRENSIWHFAAVRLLTNGQIDSGFGENGIFLKPTTQHTIPGKILIQPDGKIIGVRDRDSSSPDIIMIRLLGSQPSAPTADKRRDAKASF